MKKYFTLTLLITIQTAYCQLQELLPDISPESVIKQKIGSVDFEIHYGRPAARGRKIFGELVPYDKVWRTGAGSGTKLSFNKPVTIGNKLIEAGAYALVTIPSQTNWIILLNTNTKKIFGDRQDGYDKETEVIRFEIASQKTTYFYESLTFDIDIINNNAEIILSWETTQIHFPILTSNNKDALETIERFLAVNPASADNLSTAANYLSVNNESPNLVLQYVDKAIALKPNWWFYELKMNTLYKMKRVDEAKKTHQAGLDYIRKAKPENWKDTEEHWEKMTEKW